MKQIQAGQFESARILLESELKTNPANPDLWDLLGIADSELQKNEPAKQAFLHGLRLAPDSVSLNENIGLLFSRQNDYLSARKYLRRAIDLGSTQPGVAFSLAAAQLRTGEQAAALSGLKALEPALANVPGYWEERGRAEMVADPVTAEASFARALELNPKSTAAANGAASAAERQHLDEKALAYLIKAKAANPDDVATLAHFGAICIQRDLGPDAVESLQRAHELAPANNAVLFLLARANITVQEWQKADELFAEYSKRMPGDAAAFYARGWVEIRLNHLDDARSNLERALRIDPNLTGARYELGQLALDAGREDEAERLLREVLKKDPSHSKANVALSDILLRRGDLAGAQSHLESAIKSDPNLPAAHYKLATVLSRKHEQEAAEKERTLATTLEADAKNASRTQLRLVLPEIDPIH